MYLPPLDPKNLWNSLNDDPPSHQKKIKRKREDEIQNPLSKERRLDVQPIFKEPDPIPEMEYHSDSSVPIEESSSDSEVSSSDTEEVINRQKQKMLSISGKSEKISEISEKSQKFESSSEIPKREELDSEKSAHKDQQQKNNKNFSSESPKQQSGKLSPSSETSESSVSDEEPEKVNSTSKIKSIEKKEIPLQTSDLPLEETEKKKLSNENIVESNFTKKNPEIVEISKKKTEQFPKKEFEKMELSTESGKGSEAVFGTEKPDKTNELGKTELSKKKKKKKSEKKQR